MNRFELGFKNGVLAGLVASAPLAIKAIDKIDSIGKESYIKESAKKEDVAFSSKIGAGIVAAVSYAAIIGINKIYQPDVDLKDMLLNNHIGVFLSLSLATTFHGLESMAKDKFITRGLKHGVK